MFGKVSRIHSISNINKRRKIKQFIFCSYKNLRLVEEVCLPFPNVTRRYINNYSTSAFDTHSCPNLAHHVHTSGQVKISLLPCSGGVAVPRPPLPTNTTAQHFPTPPHESQYFPCYILHSHYQGSPISRDLAPTSFPAVM